MRGRTWLLAGLGAVAALAAADMLGGADAFTHGARLDDRAMLALQPW